MGRQLRKWLAASVAAVIGLVAVWIFSGDSEPTYEGKSLSDWVLAMRAGPDREKARAVVHQMGTNYWPVLVEWLKREDRPTVEGRYYSLKEGAQNWMVRHKWVKPHPISMHFDPKGSYHFLGLQALEELGPDGKESIPTLIDLLGDKGKKPDDFSIAGAAFLILPKMSPDSIAPLIHALSSSNLQVQVLASGALANIGTNASAAIPIFETWLRESPMLLLAAVNALEKIGGNPKVFVPVVIASLDKRYMELLDHTPYDTLPEKLDILVKHKSEAGPAVPKLVAIYTDTPSDGNSTNIYTRDEVMAVLKQIDPEAAAKVGKK